MSVNLQLKTPCVISERNVSIEQKTNRHVACGRGTHHDHALSLDILWFTNHLIAIQLDLCVLEFVN